MAGKGKQKQGSYESKALEAMNLLDGGEVTIYLTPEDAVRVATLLLMASRSKPTLDVNLTIKVEAGLRYGQDMVIMTGNLTAWGGTEDTSERMEDTPTPCEVMLESADELAQ